MLSNFVFSLLALTSMVAASPALRREVTACPTALFDGCNPARSACPNGPGTFTTVSPSTYPTSYVINGQTVSLTAAPTSCLPTGTASSKTSAAAAPTSTASGCAAKNNICKTTRKDGLSANQAQCAADNDACVGACYATYNTCRVTRKDGLSANQAQCVGEYANCLGENPVSPTGGLTILPYSAKQTSAAATTMATSTVAAPAASSAKAAAAGSSPKKVDGKTWTLSNVIRYCGESGNTCDYNFDIVSDGKTEHCTIVNAPKQSFSSQKCANDDYTVSWGYSANPTPAFAVITVVDKSNQLAWFGASNVDSQRTWGTLGPEQVFTYN